jgi:hypothetical protein
LQHQISVLELSHFSKKWRKESLTFLSPVCRETKQKKTLNSFSVEFLTRGRNVKGETKF